MTYDVVAESPFDNDPLAGGGRSSYTPIDAADTPILAPVVPREEERSDAQEKKEKKALRRLKRKEEEEEEEEDEDEGRRDDDDVVDWESWWSWGDDDDDGDGDKSSWSLVKIIFFLFSVFGFYIVITLVFSAMNDAEEGASACALANNTAAVRSTKYYFSSYPRGRGSSEFARRGGRRRR